jgi:hypothetical protein
MNCETCQLKELVRFLSHPLPQFPSGCFDSFLVADFDSFLFLCYLLDHRSWRRYRARGVVVGGRSSGRRMAWRIPPTAPPRR